MLHVKVGQVIIRFSTFSLLGQYVFIETSAPRQLGDNAYLLSQPFDPAPSGRCLKFWHHMRGASIGNLTVYLHTGNFSAMQLLWQRNGNKGSTWMIGQTPITSSVKYQVLMMSPLTVLNNDDDEVDNDVDNSDARRDSDTNMNFLFTVYHGTWSMAFFVKMSLSIAMTYSSYN